MEVSRSEFDNLRKDVDELKIKNKEPIKKEPRKPTEYNLFIAKEILKIKAEDASIDHQQAFKKAVESWNKNKSIQVPVQVPVLEPVQVPVTQNETSKKSRPKK